VYFTKLVTEQVEYTKYYAKIPHSAEILQLYKNNQSLKESGSSKTGLTCVKPVSTTSSCLGNRPPIHRSKNLHQAGC